MKPLRTIERDSMILQRELFAASCAAVIVYHPYNPDDGREDLTRLQVRVTRVVVMILQRTS